MVQIINDPGRASLAGALFGQGLGSGLQALAEYKINEMIQGKQHSNLARSLEDVGVSKPWANYISRLPANQQLAAFNQYGQAASSREQQSQETSQPISSFSQLQAMQQPSLQESPALNNPVIAQQLMNRQPQTLADLLSPQSNVSDLVRQSLSKSQVPEQLVSARTRAPMITSVAPVIQQVPVSQQTSPLVAPIQQQQRPVPSAPISPAEFTGTKTPGVVQDLQREKFESLKQEKIDKKNAPVVKALDSGYESASEIRSIAERMLDLVGTGNVLEATSLRAILPERLQSAETQEFDTLSKQLATKLASQLGVPTNAKIKLAQDIKPNLRQKRSVQENQLKKIIERTEEPIRKYEIKEQILSEGPTPDKLSQEINKRYIQSRNSTTTSTPSIKVGESFDTLSDLLEVVPEGTEFESNGRRFIKRGGKAVSL